MKIKKIAQSAGVVANVVDNLETASPTDALSANQGKILSDRFFNGNTQNNVDANDYTTSGTYYLGSGCSNVPEAYIKLYVNGVKTANNISQIGVGIISKRMYFRTKETGTWKPWAEVPKADFVGQIDCNNYKTPGVYGCYNSTNAPLQTIGVLEVLKYSDDWILQRFTDIGAQPYTYERCWYSGNKWGQWYIKDANKPMLKCRPSIRRDVQAPTNWEIVYMNCDEAVNNINASGFLQCVDGAIMIMSDLVHKVKVTGRITYMGYTPKSETNMYITRNYGGVDFAYHYSQTDSIETAEITNVIASVKRGDFIQVAIMQGLASPMTILNEGQSTYLMVEVIE